MKNDSRSVTDITTRAIGRPGSTGAGSADAVRSLLLTMLVVVALTISLTAAVHADTQGYWHSFQNSRDNNGVTDRPMPTSYQETALKWGRQLVSGYTTSFTPPLIIGGDIYTASNKRVYRIDKSNGNIRGQSDEMEANTSYAMHPMTYAEDKDLLFIPLLDGRVQCLKASTLELKWISKAYDNYQALSPITYRDGQVYTGAWSGEVKDGVYFALDADTGKTVWEFRPAETTRETTARDLGDFKVPSGSTRPENYYTYTALVTIKAKDGYKLETDKYNRVFLYTSDGTKVVPEGTTENKMVQSTVNGYGCAVEDLENGQATIRVRFDCYQSQFSRQGSTGHGSSIAIEGLDAPVVGRSLDTDVTTSSPVTVQSIKWVTGDIPHGFYWAGCYANDDYIITGSDDGQNNTFGEAGESSYTDTAILYSINRRTGALVDRLTGIRGDIRSTIVQHKGYVYFTTKGGQLWKVKLGGNGKFSDASHYQMDGMMTASPVVHNGRIYVGVSGLGGQFNADGGHLFAVLSDQGGLDGTYDSKQILPGAQTTYPGSLIYTTQIAGYPQASPLLSTATENADGKVRLYFTFNAFPGGIYYLEDSTSASGTNHPNAELLFKPEKEMQQYCLSPICADEEGTIYIKNDSGTMMAAAVNKAYLPSLDEDKGVFGIRVSHDDEEVEWNMPFESGILKYRLRAPNGVTSLDYQLDVPQGMTATINGKAYTSGKMSVPVPEDPEEPVLVKVSTVMASPSDSRTYELRIATDSNNADLGAMVINASNSVQYSEGMHNVGVGYDPVLDPEVTAYVSRTYDMDRGFLNVWLQPSDPKASVSVYPVSDVGNTLDYVNQDGSIKRTNQNGKYRYPVYWVKGKNSAVVRAVVTAPSGNVEKEYMITLVRSKKYVDTVGTEELRVEPPSVTLYTAEGARTWQAIAKLGDSDVTSECVWQSSRPDKVTVDSSGYISALGDEYDDAVVWARYGTQDTKESPVHVKVTKPTAAAPEASLSSGTYGIGRSVTLNTSSQASVYYNMAEAEGTGIPEVSTPTKNSTPFTNPIALGEDGAVKTYRIKAIAIGDGYKNSPVADYKYTIDLRYGISTLELTDLQPPEPGTALDTDVQVGAEHVSAQVVWYSSKDGYKKSLAVGAIAEKGVEYRAGIRLTVDKDKGRISPDAVVSVDGKPVRSTPDIDADGEVKAVEAVVNFATQGTQITTVEIDGIRKPAGGMEPDLNAVTVTEGVKVLDVLWADLHGEPVDEADYDSEYSVEVRVDTLEGYTFAESLKGAIKRDGAYEEAVVRPGGDGTYILSLSGYRTEKLKVDTSEGNGLRVEPGTLPELANGISIKDLIDGRLKSCRAFVTTEDGKETELPQGSIVWDENAIKAVYDPNALNGTTFAAVGVVTLPGYMDANGSSLKVTVNVKVKEGVVEAPTFSIPSGGTYKSAQTVSITSKTPGTGIYYTISGENGTKDYFSPITVSGIAGAKQSITIKAYAMANGIKSPTVTLTVTIDRSSEAGPGSGGNSGIDQEAARKKAEEAAKQAARKAAEEKAAREAAEKAAEARKYGDKDKITPSDATIDEKAKVNKKLNIKVGSIATTASTKKKNMTVKWKKVSGATNYRIAYKEAKAKKWKYKWSGGKTKVTLTRLKANGLYDFKLQAVKKTGSTWTKSGWSKTNYRFFAATTQKVKAGKKKAVVTVKKVKGASGYEVVYSLKKSMKPQTVKAYKGGKKVKLTVKKLKSRKTYYIQTRPYKTYKGKKYTGVLTGSKAVKVK